MKKDLFKKYLILIIVAIVVLSMTSFCYANGNSEELVNNYGLLTLVTPLLAIALSFITKQVILSLAIAVLAGSTILSDGNVLMGFLKSCDTYIMGTVTDSWNAALLVFILGVGGFVAVMAKLGGTQAIANVLSKKSKNSKNTLLITWFLGLVIFFEDMANSLIVGPTMRPVTDKHLVSREKLSYIIDSTAAPVTDMSIISSWIAYEISMISIAFATVGIENVNVYGVFLKTIPYRFYNIFAIAMVLIIILLEKDYGPMYDAEKRSKLTGKLYADNSKPMMSKELEYMSVAEGVPLRMRNAIVPICCFIATSLLAIWYTGGGLSEPLNFQGLQNAFGNADAAISILYSVIFSSVVAIVMGIIQKVFTLREGIDIWVSGCKELLLTDIILVLAWSSGGVMRDLGTGAFIAGAIGDSVPSVILPAALFIIACFVAFSTGTSFGTTAIMIPIAFPMAMAATGGEINNFAIATIAAVTSGAIFGDHCSPISDTTIMSAMGSGADLLDHVKTQLPYAVTVAVVSTVFGFIPAALGLSPIIIIPIGIVALFLIVKIFGKSIKEKDLQAIRVESTDK